MRSLSIMAVLILGTFNVGMARGQQHSPWLQQRVVLRYARAIHGPSGVVDDGRKFRSYTVGSVNGEWLWLVAGKIKGWVESRNVIPYDQAIDFYTQEIRADPANAAAHIWRGMAWSDRKEYDRAIADYTEAIRLDPNGAWAYRDRGNAWRDKGEYDQAIADYTEAIRLDPKDSGAFIERGIAWGELREYDKAIADYTEAIRLDTTNVAAWNNRGNAWRAKGEYDRAIADFNEAIRLDPREWRALGNRGATWVILREYDRAIADYTEATRLDPSLALVFYARGNAWGRKEEYEKAVADYTEAIRLDPKFSHALEARAWIWATCPADALRDGKRAVESATLACELTRWKDAHKLDTLAAAYAEAGDFDKAVEFQERANTLQADDESKQEGEERLLLYRDKKPYRAKE